MDHTRLLSEQALPVNQVLPVDQAISTERAMPAGERDAVYRAIFTRRDVRSQFLSDAVADDVLARILTAAHYAPSVGFMQPWSFTLVRTADVKQRVHALFKQADAEAALMFEGEQRLLYQSLKLEGIREAPINICITCDRERAGPVVIGRTHIKTMDEFSSVCAVQNLWLAARAEGLGVGWVSILDPNALHDILGIPEHIVPIAYLCLGYVSHFKDRPELEQVGWRKRLPLPSLLNYECWGGKPAADDQLAEQVQYYQAQVELGNYSISEK